MLNDYSIYSAYAFYFFVGLSRVGQKGMGTRIEVFFMAQELDHSCCKNKKAFYWEVNGLFKYVILFDIILSKNV